MYPRSSRMPARSETVPMVNDGPVAANTPVASVDRRRVRVRGHSREVGRPSPQVSDCRAPIAWVTWVKVTRPSPPTKFPAVTTTVTVTSVSTPTLAPKRAPM